MNNFYAGIYAIIWDCQVLNWKQFEPIEVEFSSVCDDIYGLGKAHMRSTPPLRSVGNVALETVLMFVLATDHGPLSSFQGRSSSAFSFRVTLLLAMDGVMSLALCPQVVVSQAPQHFRSSGKQATCEGCFSRQ